MAFTDLTIHESEYPQRLTAVVKTALRTGRFPGKLLYHSPAQAQLVADLESAPDLRPWLGEREGVPHAGYSPVSASSPTWTP